MTWQLGGPVPGAAEPDVVTMVTVAVDGPAGALRCRCRVRMPEQVVLVVVDQAPPGALGLPVVEAVSALVREYARLAPGE